MTAAARAALQQRSAIIEAGQHNILQTPAAHNASVLAENEEPPVLRPLPNFLTQININRMTAAARAALAQRSAAIDAGQHVFLQTPSIQNLAAYSAVTLSADVATDHDEELNSLTMPIIPPPTFPAVGTIPYGPQLDTDGMTEGTREFIGNKIVEILTTVSDIGDMMLGASQFNLHLR